MAAKKIVLKVGIICKKCTVCIMVAIAKFQGIVSMALDVEKSTVTIVGDVDAVLIVKALRKNKKVAEIVSVGEDKKPEDKKPDPPKEKEKEKEKEKDPCSKLPACCNACRTVVVWDDQPAALCIIS